MRLKKIIDDNGGFHHEDSEGVWQGEAVEYGENQDGEFYSEYLNYKDGELHGEYVGFVEGKRNAHCSYKDGKQHGECISIDEFYEYRQFYIEGYWIGWTTKLEEEYRWGKYLIHGMDGEEHKRLVKYFEDLEEASKVLQREDEHPEEEEEEWQLYLEYEHA